MLAPEQVRSAQGDRATSVPARGRPSRPDGDGGRDREPAAGGISHDGDPVGHEIPARQPGIGRDGILEAPG